MPDGAIITEQTADFGRFVAIVFDFWHDPDCTRLTRHRRVHRRRKAVANPPP